MMFIASALLAFAAFKVAADPHPETGATPMSRSWTHHISNNTLAARAEKGICTTLELPTEASYKLGYETFCKRHAPANSYWAMTTVSPEVVATYMLKSHTGSEIPWIFKIKSEKWSYWLRLDKCLEGFRVMLEGPKVKLGDMYCVVDNSGGNGDSKKFSGQGFVLIKGDQITWPAKDLNEGATYETRRRKGKFDPNNPN